MKFQYLRKITDKKAEPLTQEGFTNLINSSHVENCVKSARASLAEGDEDGYRKSKQMLPAIQWCGYDATGNGARNAAALTHTGMYIIDIDHMKGNPREVWEKVIKSKTETSHIVFAHVTPSGKGLRLVGKTYDSDFTSLQEYMDSLVEALGLREYGDYDTVCKDFSRVSFVVPKEDWLLVTPLEELDLSDCKILGETASSVESGGTTVTTGKTGTPSSPSVLPMHSAEEYEYKGHKIQEIVDKYLLVYGEPEDGDRHRYYNEMVKNFRHILNNNPVALATCLPLFSADYEHRLSQCKSICKSTTGSRIPREFYFFLLDHGFYPMKERLTRAEQNVVLSDDDDEPIVNVDKMPTLPPVFREFCACAPKDFVYPTITALMPIMGTLTSFLRSEYSDGTEQSTTFFNCVYASAGSGKSFVQRLMDPLFSVLNQRDDIAALREQIYVNAKASKGANEKDPKDPHTQKRIMEAINSQPEFLTKMRDNKGYHMFTFAEEVDTFSKGSKGGGIDKSDMFRIAWDNGLYGQAYKSANTFKGKVRLYYNILLTGTPNQVLKYYDNVENGMVTRVSFCPIENQRFAKRPLWKKLNEKQKKTIMDFVERCDYNTYKEPLNFSVEDAVEVEDSDFDSTVPWDYHYKPFQHIDLGYLIPVLDRWLEKQRKLASMAEDDARDTFRRRTALKAFRLAMICHACWKKVTKKEQKVITDFITWWMDKDLDNSLILFGKKYNDEQKSSVIKRVRFPNLLGEMPQTFDKATLERKAKELGFLSSSKHIVSRWVVDKLVKKIEDGKWCKL